MPYGPPVPVPRTDAVIECWVSASDGWPESLGTFKVNDVTKMYFPWKMQINGKSVDHKSTRHGVSARVAPSTAGIVIDYAKQSGERPIVWRQFGKEIQRAVHN